MNRIQLRPNFGTILGLQHEKEGTMVYFKSRHKAGIRKYKDQFKIQQRAYIGKKNLENHTYPYRLFRG